MLSNTELKSKSNNERNKSNDNIEVFIRNDATKNEPPHASPL